MLQNNITPQQLSIRNHEHFMAGLLTKNYASWEKLIPSDPSPLQKIAIKTLKFGADILDFQAPFKGQFKGKSYNSALPPPRVFKNSKKGRDFASFIASNILNSLKDGSITIWGRVGECEPPHLVLPLTVEPTKPRLIHDCRFLNLWQAGVTFSLETLKNVPALAPKGTFFTTLDEKSSYDGHFLTPSSRKYFGIQFAGWYFCYTTITFGWKMSAVICQQSGLLLTSVLRSLDIPCIQYLDDRWLCEWLGVTASLCSKSRRAEIAVTYAMALMHSVGYTFSLKKCCPKPDTFGVFLGLQVDTLAQQFSIPEKKLKTFSELREKILSLRVVPLRTLQRFAGKACSFILCVPGAKLFCRELNRAIGTNDNVPMYEALKQEISHWRFLDSFCDWKPWRSERHVQLQIATDSSSHAWGVHTSLGSFRDYWTGSDLAPHIHIKEGKAVVNGLTALSTHIKGTTVDVLCDNQAFVRAWNSEGSRDRDLTSIVKQVFSLQNELNCDITLTYVNTKDNLADLPSRVLSAADCSLSKTLWDTVDSHFGPHTWDLMSLDSNVAKGADNKPLPHFTPFPTPLSSGVNVLAQTLTEKHNYYCFPPFVMIPVILRFLMYAQSDLHLTFTIIVPKQHPVPTWWPVICSACTSKIQLARTGDTNCLRVPSKKGFVISNLPIRYDLYAFKFSKHKGVMLTP